MIQPQKFPIDFSMFSMDETEKISSAADVEWQRYEYVNENPKGTATKRRLTLVEKVSTSYDIESKYCLICC
jgi:hypothetical protein